jgi:hypothetical protein
MSNRGTTILEGHFSLFIGMLSLTDAIHSSVDVEQTVKMKEGGK